MIRLYVLHKWSVLCVHVCGWYGSDMVIGLRHTGHVISVMSFQYVAGWDLTVAMIIRSVRTGHVVSVVFCICWVVVSIIY